MKKTHKLHKEDANLKILNNQVEFLILKIYKALNDIAIFMYAKENAKSIGELKI